eukprot:14384419-Ditylum_brightwellii.AAC.1
MFVSSVCVGAVVIASSSSSHSSSEETTTTTTTTTTGVTCGAALMRDVIVFFVCHLVAFYHLRCGVIGSGAIVTFFALYFSYVIIVLAADLFHGKVVKPRLERLLSKSMTSMTKEGGCCDTDKLEYDDNDGNDSFSSSSSSSEDDHHGNDILGLGKVKKKNIIEESEKHCLLPKTKDNVNDEEQGTKNGE